MRLSAFALCLALLTGCTVAPKREPCPPLPTLDSQPTDAEFRTYIETLALLYTECAAR